MNTLTLNGPHCQFTGQPYGACTCHGCRVAGYTVNGDTEATPEAEWSKSAALATMKCDDPAATRHSLAALEAARRGDNVGAQRAHIRAAKRHGKLSDKAADLNDPFGGTAGNGGLSRTHSRLAGIHTEAAAMHAVAVPPASGDDDDGDDRDDAATANYRQEIQQMAELNRQRRQQEAASSMNAAEVAVNARFDNGAFIDCTAVIAGQRRAERKPTGGLVVNGRLAANQRHAEVEQQVHNAMNALWGADEAWAAQSRRSLLYDGGMTDSHSLDTTGMMGSSASRRDGVTDPNHGGSGRAGASADGSGGELPSTYDSIPMRSIHGGNGSGVSGFEQLVPGTTLDAHEQAEVDALRAERLGLHYDPADGYQLTTPRTMEELLARERYDGHTRNQSSDDGSMDALFDRPHLHR